jgi:hypothetical protein
MEDKDELNKSFVETTKETLKEIVDEAVNKNLRSLISEADEDDFEEEEVDSKDLTPTDDELKGDEGSADDSADDSEPDVAGGDDEFSEPDVAGEDGEYSEPDTAGDDDEVWSSLEQYKDEDGEYDLTSMASDDVVKVLKVMKPEDGDGVRVIKKDDGNITLIDDENDTEYLIVIGDDEDGEYGELGESVVNEGNVDLGYTDNYQDKTAMTMDPDDGAKTRKWNAGTPTGNGKRWVGNKGDMSPYNQKVNEGDCEDDDCIVEIEMDECGDAPMEESAMTMSNKRTDREPNMEDNGHERERRHRNRTGVNPTMNKTNESIDSRVSAITNENKQLKDIAGQLKESLNDACVINASLGKIIKLVTENTTTREEKLNIINRFNDVKTVEEGKKLYETISEELKRQHPINKGVDAVANPQQISESKKTVVETPLYESTELSDTISLMHRLDNIK